MGNWFNNCGIKFDIIICKCGVLLLLNNVCGMGLFDGELGLLFVSKVM